MFKHVKRRYTHDWNSTLISSVKRILGRGVVAWERRCHTFSWCRNAFPHLFVLDYIKPWMRSYRCASDTQIRTDSQKYTVEQEDPVWKFLQNAHFIRNIWCRNGVPTPLFSALHP